MKLMHLCNHHRHGAITTVQARCSSTQCLRSIQAYATLHKTRINADIKITSDINLIKRQIRNHLLLNMDDTTSFDDVKTTIANLFANVCHSADRQWRSRISRKSDN
eukprot:5488211-Amphidinium_carterae.4